MRDWSSRDVALVLAFQRNQSKREKRATKPSKLNLVSKQQTQQEMIAVLDKL